jgi:hypothetical protein
MSSLAILREYRNFCVRSPSARGVIEAFYHGYVSSRPDDYEFLCKLDLDLRIPPRYFEILIERMREKPRIGTCSGKLYIEEGGRLVFERQGDDISIGMTKFYRLSCFKEIGGFVREVMWDGNDRGGAGFSDAGISGFRTGRQRNRRNEVHEEAKT